MLNNKSFEDFVNEIVHNHKIEYKCMYLTPDNRVGVEWAASGEQSIIMTIADDNKIICSHSVDGLTVNQEFDFINKNTIGDVVSYLKKYAR